MRKFLVGLFGFALLAFSPLAAHAFGPGDCSGTINQQVGSIVQWKNSTGAIHPAILVSFDAVHLKWNLVTFTSTGATSFVTDAVLDQTQSTNSTYAMISCATPF